MESLRPPYIFSYVVDHDYGYTPNPYGDVLAIVGCKYKHGPNGRNNIQELAELNDWVIGTGGLSAESCGNGKLLYAMRVTKILKFNDYWTSEELAVKRSIHRGHTNRWPTEWYNKNIQVLLSTEFVYFGKQAINIPSALLAIQKKGQGFKRIGANLYDSTIDWLEELILTGGGMRGDPCVALPPDTSELFQL